VPRDAILAIAVLGQLLSKCLVRAKAITCIVQDVDEFERAFDPEVVAFSLSLQTVLDFHPSKVEVAFDVGQPAGVCGLRFDLLLHFLYSSKCSRAFALRLVLHQWALNKTNYERGYLRAAAYECGYLRAVAIWPWLFQATAHTLVRAQESL